MNTECLIPSWREWGGNARWSKHDQYKRSGVYRANATLVTDSMESSVTTYSRLCRIYVYSLNSNLVTCVCILIETRRMRGTAPASVTEAACDSPPDDTRRLHHHREASCFDTQHVPPLLFPVSWYLRTALTFARSVRPRVSGRGALPIDYSVWSEYINTYWAV